MATGNPVTMTSERVGAPDESLTEQVRTAKVIQADAFERGRAAGFEYAARYVLDRAEQYAHEPTSHIIRDLGVAMLRGEAKAAADHGELDDAQMNKDVARIRSAARKAARR